MARTEVSHREMTKLREILSHLSLVAILGTGLVPTAAATPINTRSAFKAEVAEADLVLSRQGFNQVENAKNGGQRSFATTALDLGDFSMRMESDEDVRTPKFKKLRNGKRVGLNRVTKKAWLRVNKTKFARVKIKNGVDLVLEFDDPIYAFGATFRGLNNGTADTTIVLQELTGTDPIELDPSKTLRNTSKSFFGFVSDVGITSITFTGHDVFGMDGLIFGKKPILAALPTSLVLQDNAVPLPGTLLLIGLGLLGASAARLRRQHPVGSTPNGV